MNILMLAQHYAPEEVSGAVLVTELAEELVQRGHRVTFVTCAPNYPSGKVFPGYHNQLRAVENCNGVKIVRVWSYISTSKGFWSRILNFATFSTMSFFGAIIAPRPNVIFSYSPPLPLGISAWCLHLLWRVPWVLRVEDLFPDAAIATGVLRNRRVISFFKGLERFLYKKATHISLISQGFRRNLLAKGVPDEKVSVSPVWADPDAIHPLPKETDFRRDHGMQGKFVILYSGNLGITSALEEVIACAVLLHKHPDIIFVFVGEGVKKSDLEQQAKGLEQVLFLPYQPRAFVNEMLASADVGLVTLNAESSPYSLPSKIFNIMASGRPILAITPPMSEVAKLLEKARCGVNVQPGDPERLAQKLLELRSKPLLLQEWGENGRSYVLENFSRKKCIDLYDATLQRVAA